MRNRRWRTYAIALALLGSMGFAAQIGAQQSGSGASGSASILDRGSTAAQLNLSPEQERSIIRSLASEQTQSLPADFQPQMGVKVPESMTLRDLPSNLASEIPHATDFKFAKLPDRVLLVDAYNRQVAKIIAEPATTGSPAGSGTSR